jgi:bifunctional non-homologous end joining protein LigD
MAKALRSGRVAKRSGDAAERSVRGRAPRDSQREVREKLVAPAPPSFIAPCISLTADRVPAGEGWLHEFKWDGYRLMARLDRGGVTLLTRKGFDWTERFPAIAAAARALPVGSAYLDGEAVVEEHGIPDFTALRRALGEGRGDKAILLAFDLLFLDGEDLRATPLIERKRRLAELMARAPRGAIVYSEHALGMGDFMMRQATALGLEGVLSKRSDRPYVSGETREWVKVKRVNRQEFVVAGYLMPKDRPQAISSLVLGWYEDGALVYKGRVGVGFDQRTARELWWKLQRLRRSTPAFAAGVPPGGARDAAWVEPALVAEVAYGHWTPGGLLRHAVFKGLREDKAPEEVTRPASVESEPAATPPPAPKARKPIAAAKPSSHTTVPAGREPSLGVPRENILQLLPDAVVPTKATLLAYWTRFGERALEHLGHRPLKLVLHRHGTTYFHKGPLPPIPASVNQLRIEKREGGQGVRLWIDSLDGFAGLVGMGVVEIHPWGATVDDIEHPDRLVFDLDPGERVPWELVTETALSLRDMLADEGLEAWPKTTGGKGLHVMVPIERRRTADQGRVFARGIVQRVASADPGRYTIAADPRQREGRIFLDYLRNGRGTTAIGAWSPRARPGFPIARPVTWRDVEKGVRADAFTIANPRRRQA